MLEGDAMGMGRWRDVSNPIKRAGRNNKFFYGVLSSITTVKRHSCRRAEADVNSPPGYKPAASAAGTRYRRIQRVHGYRLGQPVHRYGQFQRCMDISVQFICYIRAFKRYSVSTVD